MKSIKFNDLIPYMYLDTDQLVFTKTKTYYKFNNHNLYINGLNIESITDFNDGKLVIMHNTYGKEKMVLFDRDEILFVVLDKIENII